MSIIEKLTEGIVNRDMKKEGQALLNKWTATGLLEGLETEQMKHNMARLLENQAKELLREASGMGARGDVAGFAAVAFPIVRRVFAGLIANDLVSVQPMSLPSGLIFFLDFVYGDELGAGTNAAGATRFGNTMGNQTGPAEGDSIYGGGKVASGISEGVNLVGATNKETLGGPRQAVGYAYGSPTGSNADALANGNAESKLVCAYHLDGTINADMGNAILWDPDLLASTDSSLIIFAIDVVAGTVGSADSNAFESVTSGVVDADFDNLAAFELDTAEAAIYLNDCTNISSVAAGDIQQIRRLTHLVDANSAFVSSLTNNAKAVRFVFVGTASGITFTSANNTTTPAKPSSADWGATKVTFPVKDQAKSTATSAGALTSFAMPLEMNDKIPEIDIKVDSIAITAQTKKLKAKWSPELGQDLNAYHNLDAEVELTSILSEQVALEIDREILADLVNGAKAATYYWSRSPGLFVNRLTGAELGATSAAPDFTGTVSEWYETLIETINDVSAQIHMKTLRGGANFVVCSPEVANILEFTSGFRANVTADADKGDIGAVKAGSLNRKFDVIVDPYFLRNVILIGRKGNSFLESGYVYAPYVPLQTTPTIFGVEDFVPRKGVMTRYAKKMVRPDMYGLVIIRGLLGESGS